MLRKALIAICSLGLGLVLGVFVLPYHFSAPKPINPEKLSGEYNLDNTIGTYLGRSVQSSRLPFPTEQRVLGMLEGEKRIEVDLTNQRLYAFQGSQKIYDFPVSTGLWGRTPTGEFRIWIKLRYTRMEGGSQALGTYYNLPNVPFTMFFYNNAIPKYRGYGIHGAYWHNNFGHPMSHGCINMKIEDAEAIF